MNTVMPIRQIGSLDVSLVGLGCNNFGGRLDEPHSAAVVSAALDAGINFFDTADVYGGTLSEEYPGPGARQAPAGRNNRHQVRRQAWTTTGKGRPRPT